MKKLIVGIALLAAAGCGGGGSSSGGGSSAYVSGPREVSFKVEPSGVTCFNQNDTKEFSTSAGSITINQKSCYWWCGNYKGQSGRMIGITWQSQNGGPWGIATEVNQTGNCS